MKKRIISIVLSIIMAVTLLPAIVLNAKAAETDMPEIKEVCFGYTHGGVITTDGRLWMWGANTYGQLGDGTTIRSDTPEKILDNVKTVSFGGIHSAAILSDGSLWTWGHNLYGQLGDGTTENRLEPVKIMDDVKSVSLGYYHSAAIKSDGSLWMWGSNSNGKVGDGTTENRLEPVKIMDDVKEVSLGNSHSAVLKTDGSLWVWGANTYGQVGDGTKTTKTNPLKIMDDVKSVSIGSNHSAAIKNDGSLWMWGSYYVTSNNSGRYYTSPRKIMDDVESVNISVASSYGTTGAVKIDGSLWMCGYNERGQVGNGTTEAQPDFVKILDKVSAVSVGGLNTGAIKTDGSLMVWGAASGIGNGSTTAQLEPVKTFEQWPLADYRAVDEAIAKVPEDLSVYPEEHILALQTALDGVVRNLQQDHQKEVDAMAKAIEDAIAALELKPADYTAVDAAKAKVPNDLSIYTQTTVKAVTDAISAVIEGMNITKQKEVDAMAKAIEDAIAALELKPADYTAVDAAKAKVPKDLSIYTAETAKAVTDAVAAVIEGKKITEQKDVNAMAKMIEDAVAALEVRPADYTAVEAAKAKVPNDLSIYTRETAQAVRDALAAVKDGKKITEQTEVNAMAKAIEDAVAALKQYADYSALEAALAKVPADLSIYTKESADVLQDALDVVEYGLSEDYQSNVDDMARSIESAVAGLKKYADYRALDAAIAKVPNDLSIYTDESVSALNTALNTVVRGLSEEKQAEVDAMARAIEDAVAGLEEKPIPADYSAVNVAEAMVPENLEIYTDESVQVLQTALDAVVRDLIQDRQSEVDAMARAIEDAVAALELKPADYTAVDAAKAKVPTDLSIYTEETARAVTEAVLAVAEGKKITEQTEVDAMAEAIEEAVEALEVKPADYSAVDAAKAKVPKNLNIYTEKTAQAVRDALAAVIEGKKITEQAEVDAMAKAIEDAVEALEWDPQSGIKTCHENTIYKSGQELKKYIQDNGTEDWNGHKQIKYYDNATEIKVTLTLTLIDEDTIQFSVRTDFNAIAGIKQVGTASFNYSLNDHTIDTVPISYQMDDYVHSSAKAAIAMETVSTKTASFPLSNFRSDQPGISRSSLETAMNQTVKTLLLESDTFMLINLHFGLANLGFSNYGTFFEFHDLEKVEGRAATCTEAGTLEHWMCSTCKKLFDIENNRKEVQQADLIIPAAGHKEGTPVTENIVDATCETAGHFDEVKYCTVCKIELSREEKTIEAKGHEWGEWIIDKEATKEAPGARHRVCIHDPSHVETEEIPIRPRYEWMTPGVDESFTGIAEEKDGTKYYVVNGEPDLTKSAIVEYDGQKYYVINGIVDPERTELIQSSGLPFVDVPEDAWFYYPVAYVYGFRNANGTAIMSGYSDGIHFGPTDPLTRGQFAVMLYRIENEPATEFDPKAFPDVTDGNFYSKPAVWASRNGYITGYQNGNFGPLDLITREQLATILYRYAVKKGYNTGVKGDLGKFSDTAAISPYAKDALIWANGAGIVTGKADGRIDPQGNAARAECAAMIQRFIAFTEK